MKHNEKTVVAGWFGYLFGRVTSSERAPEKNSCAEIFSLALTRREICVLMRSLPRIPNDRKYDEENWNTIQDVCKKIRSLADNIAQ